MTNLVWMLNLNNDVIYIYVIIIYMFPWVNLYFCVYNVLFIVYMEKTGIEDEELSEVLFCNLNYVMWPDWPANWSVLKSQITFL